MSRIDRGAAAGILVGYLLRVALIVALVPTTQAEWFGPFVDFVARHPSIDPWQAWLDSGGDGAAFPYGVLMVVLFALPSWLLGLLGVDAAALWVIPLVLLVFDLATLRLLVRGSAAGSRRTVTLFWALSPVVIYASFVHGQLDLVPAALIFWACLRLNRDDYLRAGLLLGIAASTKLSAVLAVPVILLFVLRNDRFRDRLWPLCLGLLPGMALALLPAVLPGYRGMVLSSPQIQAIFEYRLEIGASLSILLAPVLLAVIVLVMWRYTRANNQLLLVFVMLVLFAVPLLSPGSPGWYVWAAPLLVYLVPVFTNRVRALLMIFWLATAASSAVTFSGAEWRWGDASPFSLLDLLPSEVEGAIVEPLLATLVVTVGLTVMYVGFRDVTRRFDSYGLSRKPLAVAVAGDSGTGKDTLCRSLADVFGGSNTSFVMGDDYHLHERGASAWSIRTHLNPAANDLAALSRDFSELIAGRPVWSQHYDHDRGRFTKERLTHHGELVVVSGLHALATEELRSHADLTVFLDMDESLRLRLKAQRDIAERGHSVEAVLRSLSQRSADREKFVLPQREVADLVMHLYTEAAEFDPLDVTAPLPPVSVSASLATLAGAEEIARTIRSVIGCQVDISYTSIPGRVIMTLPDTTWISATDIRGVAGLLIQRPEELSSRVMMWQGGSVGVTQLLLVLALLERRRSSNFTRSLR